MSDTVATISDALEAHWRANFHRGITPGEMFDGYAKTALSALKDAGMVVVPREPTEAMLAATCEESGRPRILELTTPEERNKPFLMPRYIYRAMIAAAEAEE